MTRKALASALLAALSSAAPAAGDGVYELKKGVACRDFDGQTFCDDGRGSASARCWLGQGGPRLDRHHSTTALPRDAVECARHLRGN